MKLKDSKTYANLAKSYAGECQARTRYEFIEYGARMNGYKYLAELVDKVVYNEFNHARMFYTFIQQSEEKQIENIDIASGYPFKENGTCSKTCVLRRRTSATKPPSSIPNTQRPRGKKVSPKSRNFTKTSFRWKPAIRNCLRSSMTK